MKARFRKDLIEEGITSPSYEQEKTLFIPSSFWKHWIESYQPNEFEHKEFNLCLFSCFYGVINVKSIDFEFLEEN